MIVPSLTVGPRVAESMHRSVRWLDRCIEQHERSGRKDVQNLFAIVHGALDAELRDQCLDEMIKRKNRVAGYAIGGLSGGEAKGKWSSLVHLFRKPINCPRNLLENVRLGLLHRALNYDLSHPGSNNARINYHWIVGHRLPAFVRIPSRLLIRPSIRNGYWLCRRYVSVIIVDSRLISQADLLVCVALGVDMVRRFKSAVRSDSDSTRQIASSRHVRLDLALH